MLKKANTYHFYVTLKGILSVLPVSIGLQEGGNMMFFTLFGLTSAAGLTFGIVKRMREFLFTLLGYLVIAIFKTSSPEITSAH